MSIQKNLLNLAALFYVNGYSKIASNIMAYSSYNKPIFQNQPGSVAPILQLSNIIDNIEKKTYFNNLPLNIIKTLLKVKKMTDNAFKFANSKKAFLNIIPNTTPIEKIEALIKNIESKINLDNLPEDILSALNNLKASLTKYSNKNKSTTDINTTKENLNPQKKINIEELQLKAIRSIKRDLANSNIYKKIFYRLPPNIIKELQTAGLDPDNLPLSTKKASLSKKISINFLSSKCAIDFSSISNTLQHNNNLSSREISRTIRLAIAAELDAIHLYELIADSTSYQNVKKVLQDIANEEKVHVGELSELLKTFDKDNQHFLNEGANETKEIIK